MLQGEGNVLAEALRLSRKAITRTDALKGEAVGETAEQRGERMKKEYLYVTVDKCAGLKNLETFGTSDPFVKVILKQPNRTIQEFKTAVKSNEMNPEFKETFEFEMNETMRTAGVHEATLSFEVWDDNIMSDDMMGKISYQLRELSVAPDSDGAQAITRTGALEGEGSDDYGTLTSMTVGQSRQKGSMIDTIQRLLSAKADIRTVIQVRQLTGLCYMRVSPAMHGIHIGLSPRLRLILHANPLLICSLDCNSNCDLSSFSRSLLLACSLSLSFLFVGCTLYRQM